MSTSTFSINTTQVIVVAALATDGPISFNDTDLGWTVPELEDYCNHYVKPSLSQKTLHNQIVSLGMLIHSQNDVIQSAEH
jgi:hypothetical protein